MNAHTSYQILLHVERPVRITAGKLGEHCFARGYYIYTGSAKRNLRARLLRHLSSKKKLHWHIDYLLQAHGVQVVDVCLSADPECILNQRMHGRISVSHFGASDCRAGCGSHLKYIGSSPACVWTESN